MTTNTNKTGPDSRSSGSYQLGSPSGGGTDAGYITVDGGQLYFEAAGSGPAVVLIHGGSVDLRMWHGQMAALIEIYQVIRYDLRGLGQSAPPTAPYRMCDDVAAVLDHLGVDAAAVVGFSTGGAVAVDFTVRYPARATALVTIGAITEREPTQIPGFDAARRDLARQLAQRDAADARGDVDAAVAVDLDVWATAHHGAARTELEEWAKANPYFHFSTSEHDEYEQINPVSDAVLATITAPTLITVGELDVGLSRLCADHLAATIPGARLRVFAGADHFVSTAERAEFNATLRTFLSSAVRSPAG